MKKSIKCNYKCVGEIINCSKKQKGITLIALVITIIVLLILAGVTINMVVGQNGIFTKATTAKEESKAKNIEEEIQMMILENEALKYPEDRSKTDADLKASIIEKLKSDKLINDINEEITINGSKKKIGKLIEEKINGEGEAQENPILGKEDNTKNRTLSGVTTGYTYKNPVIPQGFKAIDQGTAIWDYKDETKTEVTGWNEGLVIQDSIGNEFVWVPVDGINVPYSKWCTIGESYSSCSDDTSAIPVTEGTQITTYGGFYVARYEAGLTTSTTSQSADINNNTSTKAVSKLGAKIWNYINYNNANAVSKAMINDSTTYGSNISGLVTGSQWDTIMKWYQNSGIKIDTTQDWGTYHNLGYTIQPGLCFESISNISTWSASTSNVSHSINNGSYFHASGLNSNGIKKNIADLGGNIWEWTAEIYSSNRVYRGGSADSSIGNSSIVVRDTDSSSLTYYSVGFRVVLYIQ